MLSVLLLLCVQTPTPTVAQARAFLTRAESTLYALSVEASRADWVANTYITFDTEELTAEAGEAYAVATRDLAMQARRYERLRLPADMRRKLLLLKLSLAAPPPPDSRQATELSRITSSMQADYGRGTYCRSPDHCLQITDIERILATSRDPAELLDAWQWWHRVSVGMRDRYARFVVLANAGARGFGFQNVGVLWRSGYDMPADSFALEIDRLWTQLKPLYVQLHAYVRARLAQRYPTLVTANGMIPADLLGNIWAQEWGNIYPLVAVANADPGYSLTDILKRRKVGALDMVRTGERFYTSLGFEALPKTFWERSLFTRPRDREVVCHASAWDIDLVADVRIKMCIEPTAEDFTTIHHELGHNFYQRAYKDQPVIFRDSANDGFHEAIGDTIALSVTPEYLVKIGLLDKAPDASRDLGLLMKDALDKIAFLPFGLLVDQWRWKVFAGDVTPEHYNKAWWDLRLKYQGIAPPSPRGEEWFDPGAKYHVPDNTPYTRYFLARILQFQFHRALAKIARCTAPLNRCSAYESQEAGTRLNAMLSMGQSRPWPDALEALTGTRQMDATAILDYFAPLSTWLDEQLAGKPVGW